MQTSWASLINPAINAPLANGLVLKSIQLVSGVNVINHLLGHKLQGWSIVRKRAAADIYDTQDSSANPALTLTLVSSAPAVVDIYVF